MSFTPTVKSPIIVVALEIEDPKAKVVSLDPKVNVTPLEPSSAFILPDCSNKISRNAYYRNRWRYRKR